MQDHLQQQFYRSLLTKSVQKTAQQWEEKRRLNGLIDGVKNDGEQGDMHLHERLLRSTHTRIIHFPSMQWLDPDFCF